ncbi:MAG TPA: ATP-binding protein [Bacteroidales bacterium]|nr:ATP-binding protein [Bacteroidales bacterium]
MTTFRRNLVSHADIVDTIRTMLPDSPWLQGLVRKYLAGEIILREGQENDNLLIILDGQVSMEKEGGKLSTRIDLQEPGDFFGLLSFHTGQPVFTTSRAYSDVTLLAINHESFEEINIRYPNISKTLQGLVFTNLADRYKRVVTLHVQVDRLSRELEKEKEQLNNTIKELERTRNMLISQEKMAVLGELTAGLAHEMNNPASAMLRSVDFLINNLPEMFEKSALIQENSLMRFFFESGQKREFVSSEEQREKTRQLAERFPRIGRSEIRIISEMPPEAFELLVPFAENPGKYELLNLYLEAFQTGVFINGIKLSAGRIENLVKSLKSFSRHNKGEHERMDIRKGLRETLMILGSRLKNIEVNLNLPEIPQVNCFPGEINQVWTNIIINACDAMEGKGKLYVSCRADVPGSVWVDIADTGPGIPNKFKKKIFNPSFTTKTAAGGEFGLGLGLSISKSIVEKHHGTISVCDRQGGGAVFTVRLPVGY